MTPAASLVCDERVDVRRRAAGVRRGQGFEAFVAGAAGRLGHAAALLTTEPPGRDPRARALLTAALAVTYARWDELRGEDPYDHSRRELVARFARSAWRHHRPRGGVLSRLTPRERLVVVLRLYEGVPEEQTAALLGLSEHRVRAHCTRAVTLLTGPAPPGRPATRGRATARRPVAR
ncbi:sigma factor-like helix-turn-helix DNA-binding protein [Streptomyces pyxinae]|uniref:sigma factor-like helix-turn-helix DNA-binding protein n=1 Tax=Streptomyces pyxinae TaxID=2970734 RepID=UPI003D181C15